MNTNTNTNNRVTYKELFEEKHKFSLQILNHFDYEYHNEFLKNTMAIESIKKIYSAVSHMFNGPREGWQDIRKHLFNNKIFNYENMNNYIQTSKFMSYNRILDDYNIIKTINVDNISKELTCLKDFYMVAVEAIGLYSNMNDNDKFNCDNN